MCLYSSVFYMCVHWGWWERILMCCLSFNAPLFGMLYWAPFYVCMSFYIRKGWLESGLPVLVVAGNGSAVLGQCHLHHFPLALPSCSPPSSHPTHPSSSLCSLFFSLPCVPSSSLHPLLLSPPLCPLLLSPPPPPLSLSSTSHPTSAHPGAHVLLPHMCIEQVKHGRWEFLQQLLLLVFLCAVHAVMPRDTLCHMWVTYRSVS